MRLMLSCSNLWRSGLKGSMQLVGRVAGNSVSLHVQRNLILIKGCAEAVEHLSAYLTLNRVPREHPWSAHSLQGRCLSMAKVGVAPYEHGDPGLSLTP